MHVEWNVFDNFLKYLSNEKDILEVWKDWKDKSTTTLMVMKEG
jgi:hypothetical protein